MRTWTRKLLPLFWLPLALFICQGCKTSFPEKPTKQRTQVKILSVGLFESGQGEEIPNETSLTGYALNLHDVTFVKETKVIPARLGTTFGFFFYVSGISTNETGKLVYSFPQIKDPKTGKLFTRQETDLDFGPNPSLFRMLYSFAEDHELVCGKWRFQVFINDRLVAAKTFTVVQANPSAYRSD